MKLFNHGKRLPLCVSLAMLLLSLSAGWARADGARPNCYVLSAGVDNYPNANRLSGCLNDARNTTAAFKAQEGLLFDQVHTQTLLDRDATRPNISRELTNLARKGDAGDFVVLFLSGHAGEATLDQPWYFLPYDFDPRNPAETTLTDRQILNAADILVKQGKKVVIIVDACFSGQLRVTAQTYMNQYRDPNAGGLILILSSSPQQESSALGDYSAFAKAFADSMNGQADLNKDGKITLEEIRQYSYKRTYQLLQQKGFSNRQDSEVAWSSSISATQPLAVTRATNLPQQQVNRPQRQAEHNQPAVRNVTQWTGSENLAGYGRLTFQLLAGQRAVMIDAQGTTEGTWVSRGDQFALQFGNVVYTGTRNGSNLSGTADNGQISWTWNVQAEATRLPAETYRR